MYGTRLGLAVREIWAGCGNRREATAMTLRSSTYGPNPAVDCAPCHWCVGSACWRGIAWGSSLACSSPSTCQIISVSAPRPDMYTVPRWGTSFFCCSNTSSELDSMRDRPGSRVSSRLSPWVPVCLCPSPPYVQYVFPAACSAGPQQPPQDLNSCRGNSFPQTCPLSPV